MRYIDFLAFGCAVLSLLAFVSSSGSFQDRRILAGTIKLILGIAAFVAGIGAGAASIGTEGYLPLNDQPTVAATAIVTPLAGDSITARVTWPDGVTRTFRLSGVRARFRVRMLHWRIGGALLGAADSWEFSGVSALSRDGDPEPGSERNVQQVRPVTVYELVQRFPELSVFVDIEEQSVDVSAARSEISLRVSSAGVSAGN